MNLKRTQPEDSLVEAFSEPDSGPESPTKKALTDVVQSLEKLDTSDAVHCPAYICDFLDREKFIFSRLVDVDFTKPFLSYLNSNSEFKMYLARLLDAFDKLSAAETARMKAKGAFEPKRAILRRLISKKNDKRKTVLNLDQLLKVLNPATSLEAKQLIEMLMEGMKSWRLPLYLNILRLSLDETSKTTFDALKWIEKRRPFIQSLMNREPQLMQWLNEEAQADMKSIVAGFTEAMHKLLSENIDINEYSDEAIEVPKFMDVKALYHTLFFKGALEGEDNDSNSQLLEIYTTNKLIDDNYISHFLSVSVTPWTCFLEMFNTPHNVPTDGTTLRVSGDVLSWLFLTHPQNEILASKIMTRSAGVDRLFEAFENHKKAANTTLLAGSMSTLLQSVNNSPKKASKKRFQDEEEEPAVVTPTGLESPSKRHAITTENPNQENCSL